MQEILEIYQRLCNSGKFAWKFESNAQDVIYLELNQQDYITQKEYDDIKRLHQLCKERKISSEFSLLPNRGLAL